VQEIITETIIWAVLLFYPAWRIYGRAGVNQNFCFTLFIPIAGVLICAGILAYSTWHIKTMENS